MSAPMKEIDPSNTRKVEYHTDFEVSTIDELGGQNLERRQPHWHLVKYLFMGILFGIVLVKSQVISWFRIQEMFRLQSFHMFGVIGSAIVVGAISVFLIKKFNVKTIYGEQIIIPDRKFSKGQIYGGLLFGFGWAMTGACPGPLFAQIGTGATVIIVSLFMAIVGTWVYGYLHEKLPH